MNEHPTPTVSIDGGEPVPCELEFNREMLDVSSISPKADPNWSTTDTHGHFHAYNQGEYGGRYPTLREQSRHVDCDGRCGGDPDECEGWTEVWYECRICGETVEPGAKPGPHHEKIEGMVSWTIEVDLTTPLELQREVSVRCAVRDKEYFGVAIAFSAEGFSTPDRGPWLHYVLHIVGALGSRPIRQPHDSGSRRA